MLAALDAMPAKRLIARALVQDGEACALGAVAQARGLDVSGVDPEDYEQVAKVFGIAEALAREIEFENDDYHTTEGRRWEYMRCWVLDNIREEPRDA
jgi:hypothetical protein